MERKGLGFERCGTGSENLEAEAVEPEEAAVGPTSALVPEAGEWADFWPCLEPLLAQSLERHWRRRLRDPPLSPGSFSRAPPPSSFPTRALDSPRKAATARPDEDRTRVASCNATRPLKKENKKGKKEEK